MRICGSGRGCTPPRRANAETEQICEEAKSFGVRFSLPLGGASRAPVRRCRTWHRRKTGEFAGRSPHPLLPTASKNSNKEVQLTNRNKDIRISFRVSKAEYQQIEAKANKAGMSISAYVRTASLRHKITVVDGLKEFTIQLKGIGRNLNQLATLANMGRIQTVGLDDVLEILRKIYDQLTHLVGQEER